MALLKSKAAAGTDAARILRANPADALMDTLAQIFQPLIQNQLLIKGQMPTACN